MAVDLISPAVLQTCMGRGYSMSVSPAERFTIPRYSKNTRNQPILSTPAKYLSTSLESSYYIAKNGRFGEDGSTRECTKLFPTVDSFADIDDGDTSSEDGSNLSWDSEEDGESEYDWDGYETDEYAPDDTHMEDAPSSQANPLGQRYSLAMIKSLEAEPRRNACSAWCQDLYNPIFLGYVCTSGQKRRDNRREEEGEEEEEVDGSPNGVQATTEDTDAVAKRNIRQPKLSLRRQAWKESHSRSTRSSVGESEWSTADAPVQSPVSTTGPALCWQQASQTEESGKLSRLSTTNITSELTESSISAFPSTRRASTTVIPQQKRARFSITDGEMVPGCKDEIDETPLSRNSVAEPMDFELNESDGRREQESPNDMLSLLHERRSYSNKAPVEISISGF
ncbi:hypothetical protein BDZ91DRAFT_732751 [Kalaharituber pfeilii]|nr:hypothetical protein BDZ91DRAFT_732751 [Kalaharituber pfeilii]